LTFRKRRLAYHGNGTSELLRCDEIAKRIRKAKQPKSKHVPSSRLFSSVLSFTQKVAGSLAIANRIHCSEKDNVFASSQETRRVVKFDVVFPILADFRRNLVLPYPLMSVFKPSCTPHLASKSILSCRQRIFSLDHFQPVHQ
jgi:hypothetical protein